MNAFILFLCVLMSVLNILDFIHTRNPLDIAIVFLCAIIFVHRSPAPKV